MRVKVEYNGIEFYVTEYMSFDTHYKMYWFTRQLYNYVNTKLKLKPFIECFNQDMSNEFTLKLESKGKFTLNGIKDVVLEATNKTLSIIFEDKMYSLNTSQHLYPVSIYLDTNDNTYNFSESLFYYKNYNVEDWKNSKKIVDLVELIVSKIGDGFILEDDYTIFGNLNNMSVLPSIEIQYKGDKSKSDQFFSVIESIIRDLFNVKDFVNDKMTEDNILRDHLNNRFSGVVVLSKDSDIKDQFLHFNGEYDFILSIMSSDDVLEASFNIPLTVENISWDNVLDELVGRMKLVTKEYPNDRLKAVLEQKDKSTGKVIRRVKYYHRGNGYWSIYS